MLRILIACLFLLLTQPVWAITWDGGGADNFWTTPENWDENREPEFDDIVIFDGTSSKTCNASFLLPTIAGLRMESTFEGTLEYNGFDVEGDVIIEGGKIDNNSSGFGFMDLGGDFIRTGGDVSEWYTSFDLRGLGDRRFETGPGGLNIVGLTFTTTFEEQWNWTVVGDINLSRVNFGTLNSQSIDTITLSSGTMTMQTSRFSTSFRMREDTRVIIEDGVTLDARESSSFEMFGEIVEVGSGKLRRNASAVGFTDENGQKVSSVVGGGDIYITLFDDDENTSGSVMDTTTVVVSSPVTGDSETLTLTETGSQTGEFRNTAPLLALNGAANPGDSILQFSGGENLKVIYIDDEDTSDTIERNLMESDLTWDGGGADENWTTAENWDPDRVPGFFDNVIFDATSTKTVNMPSIETTIQALTIEPGYSGILNKDGNSEFRVKNTATLNGGTLDFLGYSMILESDLVTSGSDTAQAAIGFEPQGTNFVSGSGVFKAYSVYINSDVGANELIINLPIDVGSLRVNGTFGDPGTLQLNDGPSTVSNIFTVNVYGELIINDGVDLDVSQPSIFDINGSLKQVGSGRLIRPAEVLAFTDMAGDSVTTISQGGELFLTLLDDDENTTGGVADTTVVVLSTAVTGDVETLTLIETGNKTGEFRNTTGLPLAAGAANPGDGILQYDGEEQIAANYTDPEDPGDMLSKTFGPGEKVWDGGGADNNWETPENWSDDELPGIFDTVIFNGTSTKDAVVNTLPVTYNSLLIEPGYTGSIEILGSGQFYLNRDLSMTGDGELTINSGIFYVGGNILQTSGSLQLRSLVLDGMTSQSTRFEGGSVSILDFIVDPQVEDVLVTFEGALEVEDTLSISSGNDAVYFTMLPGSSIVLSGDSSTFYNDIRATLTIEDGAVLDARNADNFINRYFVIQNGSGRLRRNAQLLRMTDSEGELETEYGLGTEAYVRLIDEDENIQFFVDTTTVRVVADVSGDSETIVLTETGGTSEEFINLVGLPIGSGTPVANNGILEVGSNDSLRAIYTDDEDTADTISSSNEPTIIAPEITVLRNGTPLTDGVSEIDFGVIALGTTETVTLSILNGGAFDLLITTATTTGNFSVIEPIPGTIDSGSSDTLTVVFAPDQTGPTSGTLQIFNNDANENPFDLALTGAVPVPMPEIDVRMLDGTPLPNGGSMLNFGTIPVGTTSTLTISILNTGSADLTITTMTTLVNPSEFVLLDPLPESIAAGSSDSLTLAYVPLMDLVSSNTLQIHNSDPDESLYDIGLLGQIDEFVPDIDVQLEGQSLPDGGGAIDFGTVNVGETELIELSIFNTGMNNLNVTTASLPANFSVESALPMTIVSDSSAPLLIGFAPAGEDVSTGTLQIFSNDIDENPYDLLVSGFGHIPRAQIALTYQNADLPNGSSVVQFGEVVVGNATSAFLGLFNNGDTTLTLSGISFPVGFRLDGPLPGPVGPGGNDAFFIVFEPDREGTFEGTMQIFSNDPDDNPFNITLEGSADNEPLTGEYSGLLNYLLGFTSDTTNLDSNVDTVIDIADLVFEIESQPPTEPMLVFPEDGATTVPRGTSLNWTETLRTDSYALWIWPEGTGQPAEPTTQGLTLNFLPMFDLTQPATQYEWRVRAERGDQVSTGTVWRFTTE